MTLWKMKYQEISNENLFLSASGGELGRGWIFKQEERWQIIVKIPAAGGSLTTQCFATAIPVQTPLNTCGMS